MGHLSPIEQKQAYLNLQAGGEAPIQGFRKPAPEKPKGELLSAFETSFLPILQQNEIHKPLKAMAAYDLTL